MWDGTSNCINEVAREVLRVSRGNVVGIGGGWNSLKGK